MRGLAGLVRLLVGLVWAPDTAQVGGVFFFLFFFLLLSFSFILDFCFGFLKMLNYLI
jgi:hypothetical protein